MRAARPCLVNKEDKPTQFDAELIAPYFAMVLPVCCQEEESRKVISAAVARLLGTSQIDPMPPVCPASVSFPPHCVRGTLWPVHWMLPQAALAGCRFRLCGRRTGRLCDLTGENASEAVIEQVFERFCVGK